MIHLTRKITGNMKWKTIYDAALVLKKMYIFKIRKGSTFIWFYLHSPWRLSIWITATNSLSSDKAHGVTTSRNAIFINNCHSQTIPCVLYCSWGRLAGLPFISKHLVTPNYTFLVACVCVGCVVLYMRIASASSEMSGLKKTQNSITKTYCKKQTNVRRWKKKM